ncbi:MAG: hypothetical protein V7760_01465 [Marinobacter sp.]
MTKGLMVISWMGKTHFPLLPVLTLQTNIYAPEQNGLRVSGHFQMNASFTPGDADEEFRSRVS